MLKYITGENGTNHCDLHDIIRRRLGKSFDLYHFFPTWVYVDSNRKGPNESTYWKQSCLLSHYPNQSAPN